MNINNINFNFLRKTASNFMRALLPLLVLSLFFAPGNAPAQAQTDQAKTNKAKSNKENSTKAAPKKTANKKPVPAKAKQPPAPEIPTTPVLIRDDLHGITLQTQQPIYAGEPFLVTVSGPATLDKVKFTWGKKEFYVTLDKSGDQATGTALALFSVPLKTDNKSMELNVTAQTGQGKFSQELNLPVAHRQYPEQRLTVAKKFVNPSPEEQERIKRESKIIGAALAGISPVRYWQLPLSRPIPLENLESGATGVVSSVYGLRRFFNGEERNPHKGVDFHAKKNDNIYAAMDGRVVLVGDFFYSGRCVFIDHGLGVFSSYLHMTEPLVEQGREVKRGQVLGLVGSTGRSTGPHLHFGFTVLGETVNPAPFMPSLYKTN